jgi:hypothetical protein
MYTPTAARPAAMPTAASYVRPGLYHYAPAPYTPRRYGQAASMAAALANYSPAIRAAYLARQWARIASGQRPNWPNRRPAAKAL